MARKASTVRPCSCSPSPTRTRSSACSLCSTSSPRRAGRRVLVRGEVQGFNAPLYLRFANSYATSPPLAPGCGCCRCLGEAVGGIPAGRAGGMVSATFGSTRSARVEAARGWSDWPAAGEPARATSPPRARRRKFWEAFEDLLATGSGPCSGEERRHPPARPRPQVGRAIDRGDRRGQAQLEAGCVAGRAGAGSSLFGRVASKDAAARVAANLALPEKVRKRLAAVVDERAEVAGQRQGRSPTRKGEASSSTRSGRR
jgi:hypothetical protein